MDNKLFEKLKEIANRDFGVTLVRTEKSETSKRLLCDINKFIPKQLVDGKCPTCGARIPQGEPFFCHWCKQALDYNTKE